MESALSAANPAAALRKFRRCMRHAPIRAACPAGVVSPCPGSDASGLAPGFKRPNQITLLQQVFLVLILVHLLARIVSEIIKFIRACALVAQNQFKAGVSGHFRVAVVPEDQLTPAPF